MTILAIDTSSVWCSVALLFDDFSFDVRHEELGNQSSQFLLPWIERLLEQNQLDWASIDAIAVSEGPGAFTGVRLGVGVAQGLAYANNKPLVPVTSLDGLACYQSFIKNPLWINEGEVVVAIDARMDQVYWARFKLSNGELPKRVGEIKLSTVEEIDTSGIHGFAGNVLSIYPERLNMDSSVSIDQSPNVSPNALGIALVASQLNSFSGFEAEFCQPLYVRDKVAQTVEERRLSKSR